MSLAPKDEGVTGRRGTTRVRDRLKQWRFPLPSGYNRLIGRLRVPAIVLRAWFWSLVRTRRMMEARPSVDITRVYLERNFVSGCPHNMSCMALVPDPAPFLAWYCEINTVCRGPPPSDEFCDTPTAAMPTLSDGLVTRALSQKNGTRKIAPRSALGPARRVVGIFVRPEFVLR